MLSNRCQILTFIIFIFCACKSSDGYKTDGISSELETPCPTDGTCTFEVLDNRSFELQYDETGSAFPSFSEDESIIIKFNYKKHEIPGTADSQYDELVYLQLEKDNIVCSLKDDELSSVKLTFARLCFCKGQTGYYKIKDGLLNIKKLKTNTYSFHLFFECGEVPQLINEVKAVFQL